MEHRRQFLQRIGVTAVAGWRFAQGALGLSAVYNELKNPPGLLRTDDVLDRESMRPRGQFYEATVPDTLDLSQRARLSVNYLTHNLDPSDWYYVYQVISFGPGSKGPNPDSRTFDITPKN